MIRRLSFGAKAYLMVAAMVLVTLGCAAALFLMGQDRALEEALLRQGRSIVEAYGDANGLAIETERSESLYYTASSLVPLPDVEFVDVYDSARDPIVRVGPGTRRYPPDFGFDEATAEGLFRYTSFPVEDKGGTIISAFLAPVRNADSGALVGYVSVGLSRLSIVTAWRNTVRNTLITAGVLLGLSAVAALLLVRQATRPLRSLSDGVRRIGQGDLSHRIALAGADEFSRLGREFNQMAGALADTTEATVRSERKYRELFEGIGQPLCICTSDGTVGDVNNALVRLLAYRFPAEVIGRSLADDVLADAGRWASLREELFRTKTIREREVGLKAVDGAIVPVLMTADLRPGMEGRETVCEVAFTDLTEVRRLQDDLVRAQKLEAMGTLAGGIAHDFNNLLATIRGCTDMLRAETGPDDPRLAKLETLKRATERAAGMTRNLLGFARRGRMREEQVDVGELIEETVELLAQRPGPPVALDCEIDPDLRPVRGDPGQIQQVLMNLCLNGREAILAAGRGRLQVSAANREVREDAAGTPPGLAPGAYLAIAVRDEGAGIPDAIGGQVFEPFFTTKRRGEGTGLGLATARNIARQHGGELTYGSSAGRGTTFWLYLPASEEATAERSPPARGQADKAPAPQPTGLRSILLVEDDAEFSGVVRAFLEGAGFNVLAAPDGRTALDLIGEREGGVDVVLLDLMLPEIHGTDLLKALKDSCPNVPVVLMSGFSEETVTRETGGRGYDGFLEKPFGFDALLATLDQAVSRWPG